MFHVAAPSRHHPCREFAPAGDLLSCAHKKVGKESAPDPPAPRVARGALRCSVLEAPRFSAGSEGGAQIPRCGRPSGLAIGCSAAGCSVTPLWRSREAQDSEARAQHASTSSSAWLSERSVAKRVPRGPRSSSIAGQPSQRADGTGATFCLLFGRSKRRSPAGANSRLDLAIKPPSELISHCPSTNPACNTSAAPQTTPAPAAP